MGQSILVPHVIYLLKTLNATPRCIFLVEIHISNVANFVSIHIMFFYWLI